jgi:hypothetical protein
MLKRLVLDLRVRLRNPTELAEKVFSRHTEIIGQWTFIKRRHNGRLRKQRRFKHESNVWKTANRLT